ncbi:MAG: SIS domain-containing protein [Candidatus Aenigmatarchaeota archaeon]
MEIKIYNKNGIELKLEEKVINLQELKYETSFEHFLIKEIYEQKIVSKILIESLRIEQKDRIYKIRQLISESNKIVFIGAGSSYNSSLIGAHLLRKLGYESYAIIASEFEELNYDKSTLVFLVSQSGETMDTILAAKKLKNKVKALVSIVNIPYSTLFRISDYPLEIKAGPEKSVAATKTYTNQVLTFFFLAKELGFKIKINKIPKEIEKTIERNENKIKEISKILKDVKDLFILGRGINFYSSLEIALKLKEISYIHAEAFYGSELKHGTLALIDENSYVLALAPFWDENIKVNIEEVEARGAKVFSIPQDFKVSEKYPEFSLYSVIIGQLLTYYTAKEKGLPIDYPRNLAKTITVK